VNNTHLTCRKKTFQTRFLRVCVSLVNGMISYTLGDKGKVIHPRGTQKVKKTWKNPDKKNQTNWTYYEKQNQQVHI
jgi:hypothetical protein